MNIDETGKVTDFDDRILEPVRDVYLDFKPMPGWIRITLLAGGEARFQGPTGADQMRAMMKAMQWAIDESEKMADRTEGS